MKKVLFILLVFASSFVYSQSTLVGLVLETVDNSSGGFSNGEVTYRLYAELNGGIITQLNGDESNPVLVSTTTSFFNQDLFGSHSNIQSDVNTGAFGFIPALQFDTWIGLGDSYTSAPSTIGDIGLDNNLSGSSWSFGGAPNSDASIFRTPDDPLCVPDASGLVLLGQFTTSGTLSGYINLEGQDANGNGWVEQNIEIPSLEEEILGCTDPSANNYDSGANTDDGSCSYASASTLVGLVLETVDNSSGGFSNGEVTYRLYAELNGGIITQLNGDESNPVLVSTTTSFFNQDLFGSHSNIQSDVNTGAFGFIPALQFDTWIGLGDSYTSAPSTIGDIGLDNNLSGSSWSFGGAPNSDASIFRTPDDPLCVPDSGLVLLGQFTTSGTLSGYINLEGQDANGNGWVEQNIEIPSLEEEILGCTDPSANNYDSGANTDDGSCSYASASTLVGLVLETVDNSSGGFSNGEVTYRLYAELNGGIITQLNGDESNPVLVSTTTSFFNQDLFGSHSNIQSDVNTGAFGFIPALQFDTWIGLGDSYTSAPSTIGDIGLDNNLSGSSWSFGGAPNSDGFFVHPMILCVFQNWFSTSWTIYYIRNTFGLYKFRRSRC